MSFTLRLALPADLDRILPLFRAYQHHYAMLTDASEAKTRAFLARLLEESARGFAVLAEDGDVLIGFATGFVTVSGVIAEDLLHLGDLYVAPDRRRQGVATALIQRIQVEARGRGLPLVRWLSRRENTDLNAWYASLGASRGEFDLFLLPTRVPAGNGT
jgi:GNAT superfamily N-acetyltransferase